MTPINLNADLGESFGTWTMGSDAALLSVINSANIACGFHAGDPVVMRETVRLALADGVSLGAHPAFPDLQGFGRRAMQLSPKELEATILYQVGALQAMAAAEGGRVSHVKPHGALNNIACADEAMAATVARAVKALDRDLILLAPALSALERAGEAAGLGNWDRPCLRALRELPVHRARNRLERRRRRKERRGCNRQRGADRGRFDRGHFDRGRAGRACAGRSNDRGGRPGHRSRRGQPRRDRRTLVGFGLGPRRLRALDRRRREGARDSHVGEGAAGLGGRFPSGAGLNLRPGARLNPEGGREGQAQALAGNARQGRQLHRQGDRRLHGGEFRRRRRKVP